jgi:hypothetical protein
MTIKGFDKFAWFKAIYAENKFTAGEKAVLGHIAIVNVLTGRDVFCLRQDTIAEQCGITIRTVNGAISRAKSLKYLTVSRSHAPGPKRHGADELQLLLPESYEESAYDSGESHTKQTQESYEESSYHSPSHTKQTQESYEAANSPTCEKDDPNSSLNSSLKETVLQERDRAAPPPPPSLSIVHANGDGSSGTGRLSAGVCAISSNGTNGQVPARIVPADLVVADMDGHDAPYLRLGFVPSASEPTLYGVTPPSRYCAKHQPSGIDGNCWGCGNARIYHDKTWPGTEHGMKYRTYQAAGDEMVKQEGRALGRDLRRQAMVEKLSRSADAAMFGFNPDSAVDQKMADWLSVKDRPEEVIEGEIA